MTPVCRLKVVRPHISTAGNRLYVNYTLNAYWIIVMGGKGRFVLALSTHTLLGVPAKKVR